MTDTIDSLRERIAKLQGEINTLQSGLVTRDEAADRLTQWVDNGASEIDLRGIVTSACTGSGEIDDDVFNAGGRIDRYGVGVDTQLAPLFAWAVGDIVKQQLLAKLDELAPTLCTTKNEKARKDALAKKLRELEELERAEESEIVKAERAGHNIARRPDCRPEIVLEVATA